MDRLTIVTADSHGGAEPEELRPYFDAEYRDWIPQLRRDTDEFVRLAAPLFQWTPEMVEVIDPDRLIRPGVNSNAWYMDIDTRLAAFDAEGVAAAIQFPGTQHVLPTLQGRFNPPRPIDVCAAGARAYNRWLAEYCQSSHGRVIGLMEAIPHPDVDALVRQLRWARGAGLGGVVLCEQTGHAGVPPIHDRSWDPLWAACVEVDFPLAVHVGFGLAPGEMLEQFRQIPRAAASGVDMMKMDESLAAAMADAGDRVFAIDIRPRRPLWQLMWAGVFDRFPSLRLAFTEVRADWIPPTLAALDAIHARGDTPLLAKPSEYWARHCAAGASSVRPQELALRHAIGVDRMMFGTDFPHPEGTFPNTSDWIRHAFQGVPEDEARRILGENAITFYGLDRQKIAAIAARVGPPPSSLLGPQAPVDARVVEHWDLRSGYRKPVEQVDAASRTAEIVDDLRAAGLAPPVS